MIKMNGGKPVITPLYPIVFNNSDYTHQYKVMERKSGKKNASTASVFSMLPHYHQTKFEHDCCGIALATMEVTNRPCSDWKDIQDFCL